MIRREGYTLLEMMIAISIFLMVMMTVGMGSLSVQQTWRKVQKHSSRLKAVQMVERVVSPAFKNAVPFIWVDDNNKRQPVFVGEEEVVQVAYLHRINHISEGAIRFLKISLSDDELIAEYRKTPILPWGDNSDNINSEVIAQAVKSVSFMYAYLDNSELTWIDQWGDEQGTKIPLAIQMTVEWENGRIESWLRRTAGSGFKEELTVRAR